MNNRFSRGHLSTKNLNPVDVCPGVRGELNLNLFANGKQLKAGSSVIIQPLDNIDPNKARKFLLTPFTINDKKINLDNPESNRKVVRQESIQVTIDNPEDYFSYNEFYQLSDDDIFRKTPSKNDLKQTRVANCFFLAAINEILNHPDGAAYIQGMMKQNNKDHTTTVRFYDPKTLKPVYVRVRNAILKDRIHQMNGHTALWLHVLENAYVAFKGEISKERDASFSTVYSEGGKVTEALSSLTGLKSDFSLVEQVKPWQFDKFLIGHLISLSSEIEKNKSEANIAEQLTARLNESQLHAVYQLFPASNQTQARQEYVKLLKLYVRAPEIFDKAMKVDKKARKSFNNNEWSFMYSVLRQFEPFTQKYAVRNQAIYDDIRSGLAAGKLIVAGTPKDFAGDKPEGLAPSHAYSIMGVYEEKMINDKNEPITARFIRLRNPWGELDGWMNTLRQWGTGGIGFTNKQRNDDKSIIVEATDEAETEIELNQFCANFEDYCYTNVSANACFEKQADVEKLIPQLDEYFVTSSLPEKPTEIDLIFAHHEYQEQLDKLLCIEQCCDNHVDQLRSLNIDQLIVFRTHGMHEREAEILKSIQDGSSFPDLWENMNKKYGAIILPAYLKINSSLNIAVDEMEMTEGINKFNNNLTAFRNFAQDVRSEQISNKETQEFMDVMIAFNLSYEHLKAIYKQYYELERFANAFYYPLESYYPNEFKKAAEINKLLQKYNTLFDKFNNKIELFEKHKKSHDEIRDTVTMINQQGKIKEAHYNNLMEMLENQQNYPELQNYLSKIGNIAAEDQERLQQKANEAHSLLNDIKRMLRDVKTFFVKTGAYLSTLFAPPNKYELPPVEAKPTFNRN